MTTSTQKNRMMLLLIAGIPVIMLLVSTWLWYYVSSGQLDLVGMLGTANRGTLVEPPRELATLELNSPEGERVSVPDPTDPKWTLLIPVPGDCDERCSQSLYYTRQIRTAMGKYTNNIDRVVLLGSSETELDADLLAEHPGLKVVYTPAPGWTQLVHGAQKGSGEPAYYLVDPAGWVMMYYRAADDGKDVMADLKFLIKNSDG